MPLAETDRAALRQKLQATILQEPSCQKLTSEILGITAHISLLNRRMADGTATKEDLAAIPVHRARNRALMAELEARLEI